MVILLHLPEHPRRSGLLHYRIVIEGLFTFHILSIWESTASMYRWIGVEEHVRAIQRTYGLAEELWSGRWSLEAVSPSARSWQAVPELEDALVRQPNPRQGWEAAAVREE